MAKPRGVFLFARPWRLKLDTIESHMTFFAALEANFTDATALIFILRPSFHTWPQRDTFSNSTQEGFK
jgi:hypothetical protein